MSVAQRAQCVIALVLSSRCLRLGPARLREGAREPCRYGQYKHQSGHHPTPAATHELGAPVSQRFGARTHGFILSVAPQIIGQRNDRLITFRRALAQRPRHDVFQITAELAPQLRQRRIAVGSHAVDLVFALGARHAERRSQTQRVGFQSGPDHLGRAGGFERCRVPADQQVVEQHAQRVDVGRRGHGRALQLLGRGVLRRQCTLPICGDKRTVRVAQQQLGDAEVEQFDVAIGGHEDVGRLDVAMDHEVTVRLGHRRQNVVEQQETLFDAEPVNITMAVDGLALHQLQDQVGLATRGDTGIEQPGDVRVREPSQDRALALETQRARAADQRHVQQLDRHRPLEAAVGAARAPDTARAALAQQCFDDVGADLFADQRRGKHVAVLRVAGKKVRLFGPGRRTQHRFEIVRHCRVELAQFSEAALATRQIEVEQFVEQGAQLFPALEIRHVHFATFLVNKCSPQGAARRRLAWSQKQTRPGRAALQSATRRKSHVVRGTGL